jgi:hypothetical protein
MTALLLALCATLSQLAYAQSGRLDLSVLDRYNSIAKETVEVALPNPAVQLMARLATRRDEDKARLRELAARLQGVYVRGFEFESEGQYYASDLDPIRAQLQAPAWQRLAYVRERNGETNEVYFMPQGDQLAGAVVLTAEPKRLCVINIVGSLTLDEFGLLDREFGIGKCGGNRRVRNGER